VSTTSQSAEPRRRDNVRLGITIVLVAVVIFGVQDAVAKLLVQGYSPFHIAMMRFWALGAFSVILALRQAPIRKLFASAYPRLQILRGICLVLDIWLFAIALVTVPLAELQAISLVYPLLVTLFAIPILGEKVGAFRITAVLAGFVGALIIVRPGGLPLDLGAFCALGSAIIFAVYICITRIVSRRDSTATSMVYVGVVGLAMTTAVGVFFWQPMTLEAVLGALVVMSTTVIAHGMTMYAVSLAPVSTLQPFNYFALPWAIFLSWQVFGHLIDPVSLIGAALIVLAGLAVLWREQRLARAGRVSEPKPAEAVEPPH
jgi:drug/metabolite transporter (DMT)-like permease